jgi:hypothetical protein
MSRLSGMSQETIHEQARHLRILLGGILGIPIPNRTILASGTTVALKLIFAGLGIETLVLGPDEYYSPAHFHPLDVSTVSIDDFQATVMENRPQAVLLSVVSWRGKRFPVERAFHSIRVHMNDNCPLLVADYSHGGAAGFPDPNALGADIIVGDLSKWLLPPRIADDLCFIYPTTSQISAPCQELFRPLFLGTEMDVERSARWVLPEQVVSAREWFLRTSASRDGIEKQHRKNLAFKRQLIDLFDAIDTDTCMVWLQNSSEVSESINPDITWRTPEGTRLLCREDVQELYKKESTAASAPILN